MNHKTLNRKSIWDIKRLKIRSRPTLQKIDEIIMSIILISHKAKKKLENLKTICVNHRPPRAKSLILFMTLWPFLSKFYDFLWPFLWLWICFLWPYRHILWLFYDLSIFFFKNHVSQKNGTWPLAPIARHPNETTPFWGQTPLSGIYPFSKILPTTWFWLNGEQQVTRQLFKGKFIWVWKIRYKM